MASSCHAPAAVSSLPWGELCHVVMLSEEHPMQCPGTPLVPQSPLLNSAHAPHPSDQDIIEQSFINVTKMLAGVNNQHFMDFGL